MNPFFSHRCRTSMCTAVGATLVALTVLLLPQLAVAQGIAVTGTGSAAFESKHVVLRGQVSKESEDAGDALSNLNALLGRLHKATRDLMEEVEGLKVTLGGVALEPTNPQAAQMGMVVMGGEAPSMKVKVSAHAEVKFEIPLAALDGAALAEVVGRVHAAARELDVEFGPEAVNMEMLWVNTISGQRSDAEPNPPFYFVVADSDAVEDAAFRAAFADAKKRATQQARVAGVTLGSVVSLKTLRGGSAGRQSSRQGEHEVQLEVVFAIQ